MEPKEILENGEFGEIPCQIAPIGEFYGSDQAGNAVKENITQESLQKIADDLNNSGEEILCDADHASVKAGADRDTHAQGWFSRFIVDPVKGLLGMLKLTRSGRESVDSREFRFLSPVFSLDENKQPTALHSVAMTNMPALEVDPILNSEPKDILKMEITKEELVQLIKDTVAAMNEAPAEEVKEEVKEETSEETKEVENSCGKEDEEVKNEEVVEEKTETAEASETKEEKIDKADEVEKVEEEKKEVIKEEVLNSAPALDVAIVAKPEWEGKHGKAFFDCLRKNGYKI